MSGWEGFADPWEHARLLSDAERNEAYIGMIARRARGQRVMEVGCGTGLLSVIAARCGARSVLAVEPTPMADVARDLVRRNGLEGVVRVVAAPIQDVAPEPVDLAFFELFNADPFVEGILPVARATAPFLADGARLAPGRLRVWAALTRAAGSALEVRDASRSVAALASRFSLDLSPVSAVLARAETYRYFTHAEAPAGPPALVWDLDLRADAPGEVEVALAVDEPGPVGGVIVWFEAALDDQVDVSNAPGAGGHWGQLVCAFGSERAVRRGASLTVSFALRGDEVWAAPTPPR